MKRRKVLASASVLAGVALTGCGGGGEDGALGGDSSSQIGAYTVPATVVPKNAQYQVEVAFATKEAMRVSIRCGSFSGTLTSKDATTNTSHRLHFATIRCNGDSLLSDFKALRVYFHTSVNDMLFVTEIGGATTNYNAEYENYTVNGTAVYEWRFHGTGGGVACVIRFIQLVGDDAITFNAGEYVRLITSTSVHVNVFSLTRVYPVHHTTNLRMVDHEVAILKGSGTKDTICIPNPRITGHDELVPSYLSASAAEKPPLRRRLLRHIARFCAKTRESHVMDTSDDQEVSHLLGNEMVRSLGGQALIDHLNYVRDNVRTSIQNNVDQMGTAFDAFCTARLPALSSQAMIDQTRALLDTAVNDENNSKCAGGCGVSTSVQFGFSITQADFWPGVDLGGGVRVSIGLAKAAKKWNSGVFSAVDLYKVGDIGTKGTKLGFTFILKGFNGSGCIINGVSADIEVTLNCTVRDSVWRLDAIQFDPVFDIDTRKWLGEMAAEGLSRLLAPAIGGTQTVAALPAVLSYGVPAFSLGLGAEMGGFAGQMAASGAQLVNAGVKNYMNPMLLKMRDALDETGADTRTYGTFEISMLRITLPNSDVNDPAIAFRGGFRYGGTGWQPGVKYIAGFGIAPSYTVPYVAPGATKPPGTVTVAGFMRVVAVADIYALYGTPEFIRATSFPWEM